MAALDEMPDELPGAREAVPLDEVGFETLDCPVDQHERNLVASEQTKVRPRPVADGCDQHTFDLEGEHVFDIRALPIEIVPRVAEDDMVSRPPCHLLDAMHNEGEERVR